MRESFSLSNFISFTFDVKRIIGYHWDMIKNFRDKDTQSLYVGTAVKKWRAIRRQAERRLQILDMATCLDDLKHLPSNHLELLKGNRKGQYSIRINNQWRICFVWQKGEPYQVEIVDYH